MKLYKDYEKLLLLYILVPLGIHAQTFTICGFNWDTIYIGTDNLIRFNNINCNPLKYDIVPEVTSKYKDSVLNILPSSQKSIDFQFTMAKTHQLYLHFILSESLLISNV